MRRDYHGWKDILTKKNYLTINFHEPLRVYLTIEKLKQLEPWVRNELSLLLDAKLYTLVTLQENIPVSANDLDNIEDCSIFIPTDLDGLDYKGITSKQKKELAKLCSTGNIVILPGFPDTFTIPLLLLYSFEVLKKTSFYFLLKPVKNKGISLELIQADFFEKLASNEGL